MFKTERYQGYRILLVVFVVLWVGLQMAGCASDSYTAKGAARGAGSGAVAGAVGGLVSALVFGGDPVESAQSGIIGKDKWDCVNNGHELHLKYKRKERTDDLKSPNYRGWFDSYDQSDSIARGTNPLRQAGLQGRPT